jgi:hypothetical protein
MLPIKKVVLFKHGVGHFERGGQINGDTSVDLYFRASEMNDVLKSLTVLDLNDGVVTSISYESTLSVEEQLRDIAIRLPEKNALSGLLSQVQGTQIAVDIGQKTVKGVVAGIEMVKRQVDKVILDSTYISLLTEDGTLQSFDLMESKQITLLDDNLKKDLQHLLDVLIAAKKKDLKKLTVFLKGEGDRIINISYIVVAPVWKTSYRLLLGSQSSLIQGWALVDNTQDEDWDNVSLSLVAGLPVSFIHDLYSPRYQKRPEVRVKQEAAYAPPESEMALAFGDDDVDYDMGDDLSLESPSAKMVCATSVMGDEQRRSMLKRVAMDRSVPIQTRTVEVGDLFHYDIENPVTVRRQQSALVPILQSDFNGKRVVVYNPDIRENNPMSAVLFKNTTGLTLENGPVTVFEEDAYMGEAMLNTLKPGEEQLVSFSVELGCVVSIEPQNEKEYVHQVRIMRGSLYLSHYELESKTYAVNNKTEQKLDMFLEHRFNSGWELVDTANTAKPVERTKHFYRFRFEVPNKKIHRFTVTESIQRTTTYALQDTSRETLKLWLEKKYIDKKTLHSLEGIIQLTEQVTKIQRDVKAKEEAIKAVFKNQERVRQNLQALGSTEDERSLRERYIASLEAEEDKIVQYQADIDALTAQKDTTENNLYRQLKSVEFKATL